MTTGLTLEKYQDVETKLLHFLDFLSCNLCKCKSTTLALPKHTTRQPNLQEQREFGWNTRDSCHHDALIFESLKLKRDIDRSKVIDWVEDLEHGLFHGFCTAFLGAWHEWSKRKDEDFVNVEWYKSTAHGVNWIFPSKFVASCLLHDFGRFTGSETRHDAVVCEYFDVLKLVANHSQPDQVNSLVIADRLELRRYDDWHQWVEQGKLSVFDDNIDVFYEYIRPVLEQVFGHRHALWMRHGVEHKFYMRNNKTRDEYLSCQPETPCPHKGHWRALLHKNGYSVETGRVPAYFCLAHNFGFTPNGYLPIDVFFEHGGSLENAEGDAGFRDHLVAVGKVPIKEWFFLADGIEKRHPRMQAKILELCESSLGLISLRLLNSFMQTINRFIDSFFLVNNIAYTLSAKANPLSPSSFRIAS